MIKTKHYPLRQQLMTLAARPQGFGKHEVPNVDRATLTTVVNAMVNKAAVARLFTAFVSKDHVRYFDKPERAAAYRDEHAIAIRPLGNHTIVRSRRAVAPAGPAVTPMDVRIQYCPGIERMYDQPRQPVVGGWATLGIGRYLELQEGA